jgi:8-oxo-dGTP diphosphatase
MPARQRDQTDARGMIQRAGREYLIVRRAHDPDAPWEFPGGPLEANESPEAALRRWCRSLLHIELEIILGQPPFVYGPGAQRVTYRFYLCHIASGEPEPAGVGELRWVLGAQLRDYVFAPAMQQVVDWIAEEARSR